MAQLSYLHFFSSLKRDKEITFVYESTLPCDQVDYVSKSGYRFSKCFPLLYELILTSTVRNIKLTFHTYIIYIVYNYGGLNCDPSIVVSLKDILK